MRKSRISLCKQYKLMEHFVTGTTASYTSKLANVNKSTAARYFQRLREIISHQLEQESLEVFEGEVEVDESYFGGIKKENVVVEWLENSLFSAFSSAEEMFILK